MGRLTARIARLEARDGAREDEYAQFRHLSVAELEARICEIAEELSSDWRNRRMSVAALEAETGWSADDPEVAALLAEAQAPEFDLERFLAAALLPATDSPQDK